MVKNLLRIIIILAGIAIGPGLVMLIFTLIQGLGGPDLMHTMFPWATFLIFIGSAVITGLIFIFLSKRFAENLMKIVAEVDEGISGVPARTVLLGCAGLIFGLLVAFLICIPINRIPILWLSVPISILVYIICAYLGVAIGVKSLARIVDRRGKHKDSFIDKEAAASDYLGFAPKILDTSVIIDGRIFDILKTGVIEGTVVIPEFVLGELRHIADSADALKRGKGRRGLDILNKIQKELDIPVKITPIDYDDVAEVDAKLLRMAKDAGGTVVTNDFNLNKVAAVQGVSVFNINELSNAVKPVLLPGEELAITIIKEGKENGQGVAYLEDGTMIVVENARARIGDAVEVVVTSVLQTSAGRMIFAKLKD